MSTVLVTGATGNVGIHVVRELRSRAATVRALVRDPQAASGLFSQAGLHDVELAVGDFDDPASCGRL